MDVRGLIHAIEWDDALQRPLSRYAAVAFNFMATLYALLCLNDLGSPRTAAWLSTNVYFTCYMTLACPLGCVIPSLRPCLGLGIVAAMAVQVTLLVTAPIILVKGAGDAAPWLYAIVSVKLYGIISAFIESKERP